MTIPAARLKGSDPPLTARGDARFWRICVALFLGGFATFALLLRPAASAQAPKILGFRPIFHWISNAVAVASGLQRLAIVRMDKQPERGKIRR